MPNSMALELKNLQNTIIMSYIKQEKQTVMRTPYPETQLPY